MDLLTLKPHGLVSQDEAFHVDAWTPADVNLVTHAHGDHAHRGSRLYWCTPETALILKRRISPDVKLKIVNWRERYKLGKQWVSFHPAGHIFGSAQIRIEHESQPSNVLVFTGDFKRDPDPTCQPFEVVPCSTFITEATFALPIYRWRPNSEIRDGIYDWWMWNRAEGNTSILFCYALGKAQRILAELTSRTNDTVLLHGATDPLVSIYRDAGVHMLPTQKLTDYDGPLEGQLILAPPSAHRSPWMKRFKNISTGFASGWMAVRGVRRGRSYEKGFVLSDHADWPSLVQTVKDTGAKRVLVTHGNKETLAKYLRETLQLDAIPLQTQYGAEEDE